MCVVIGIKPGTRAKALITASFPDHTSKTSINTATVFLHTFFSAVLLSQQL